MENPQDPPNRDDGIYSARPASAESMKSPSLGYAQRLQISRAEADKERRRKEIDSRLKDMRLDLKNARLLRVGGDVLIAGHRRA